MNNTPVTVNESNPAERRAVDVQSLWRRRGWRPPTEYRQDFEKSCKPAILAGLTRLAPGRTLG